MTSRTRRSFLQTAWALLAGLAADGRAPARAAEAAAAGSRARVVVARRPGAVGEDLTVRAGELPALLEAAIRKATGAEDLVTALGGLFGPEDRVGIKVNCLAGRGLSSHPELVDGLVKALRRVGLPAGNLLVWDRSDADLRRAGFTVSRSGEGPRCYGTDLEYEERPEEAGSVGSCFSKILTRWCTALINVPVLKDHDLSGVSGALKNFYGAIHNPNKYHDNNCHPYVAEVNTHPAIRGNLRLVVCDALVAQYHGGPAFKPEFAWPFGGLLVSTDPVAVDRVAWKIIEEKRKEMGLPSLEEAERKPRWIAAAQELGLGVGELERIDEVSA